nr:hypothetical protein [Tanacetum cinerariifolium]
MFLALSDRHPTYHETPIDRVEGYTEEIVHDFEDLLKTIFGRQVNRVHVLDFEGFTPKMRQNLAERLRMVYARDDGIGSEMGLDTADALCFELGGARRSMTWRHVEGRKSGARFSGGHFIRSFAHHFGLVSDDRLRGLSIVTRELPLIDMVDVAAALRGAEDASNLNEGAQDVPSPIHAPLPPPTATSRTRHQRLGRLEEEIQGLRQDVGSLHGLVESSMTGQAQHLFRHVEGRKSGARFSGGHFIRSFAHHFGLVSDDRLRGLSIVTRELPLIDMGKLVKPNICIEVEDY